MTNDGNALALVEEKAGSKTKLFDSWNLSRDHVLKEIQENKKDVNVLN